MLPATVPVVIARVPVVVVREVEVQPLPHRGAAVFAKTRVFLTCRGSCQDTVLLHGKLCANRSRLKSTGQVAKGLACSPIAQPQRRLSSQAWDSPTPRQDALDMGSTSLGELRLADPLVQQEGGSLIRLLPGGNSQEQSPPGLAGPRGKNPRAELSSRSVKSPRHRLGADPNHGQLHARAGTLRRPRMASGLRRDDGPRPS